MLVDDSRKELDNRASESLTENLTILQNELDKALVEVSGFAFATNGRLTPNRVTPGLLDSIDFEIDRLHEYYKANYRKVSDSKEALNAANTATPEKRDALVALKARYHNDQLEEFVTNSGELDRLVSYDGELVQKVDPIYLKPVHRNWITAHFYAPVKYVFGHEFSTFAVNVVVIWMMTLILAIVLFFDGLRWFIETLSGFASRLSSSIRRK